MNRFILAIFLILFSYPVFAQEEQQTDAKLDSILIKQDKLLDKQDKIFEEVKYDDPLQNRHVGVEFNPALFLIGTANESWILSGGFSLFNAAPHAEIAFPVWYHNEYGKDETYTVLTADAIYRYFFSKYRRGFYISAGVRYAYLEGENNNYHYDYMTGNSWDTAETNSTHKFGVHFGIGIRLFAHNGLFWGASLITGTYFSDDTGKFDNIYMDAGKFLFDLEFLKFGYAF